MSADAYFDEDVLRELSKSGRWPEILRLTEVLTPEQSDWGMAWFFRGLALLRVGRLNESILAIEKGLIINPNGAWGNQLAFEAYLANGDTHEAFKRFADFISSAPHHERQKAYYVQKAAELDLFELAIKMNETRAVIRATPVPPKYALALQCFAKPDTLEQVFSHVLKLHNSKEVALVMIVDRLNSEVSDKYREGNKGVLDVIGRTIVELSEHFFSVEILQNDDNLGTAPTCRRLLDYVANNYDGFLFVEDDCLLAPSALDWVRHHLGKTVSPFGSWFLTCESPYFDRQNRELTSDALDQLTAFASRPELQGCYVTLDFVPSTCFGTRSEFWRLCASARSFTQGPESLNRFVRSIKRTTISPVVPLAADIGMTNERGYSTITLGRENIQEIKATILLATGGFEKALVRPFDGDTNLLYGATSLLKLDDLRRLEADFAGEKVREI